MTELLSVERDAAVDEPLLARLDRAERQSSVAVWRAAEDAGIPVTIFERGDVAMAASPAIRGPAFNNAGGPVAVSELVVLATEFFDRQMCHGWLFSATVPWADTEPDALMTVLSATPTQIADGPTIPGLTIRPIARSEGPAVVRIHAAAGSVGVAADQKDPWAQVYERLAGHPNRTVLLAECDGRPVAAASVHISGGVGWLRGGSVIPSFRGLGIQRALIGARARLAAERGCDLVGAWVEPGSKSANNAERMGFRSIGTRTRSLYVPGKA